MNINSIQNKNELPAESKPVESANKSPIGKVKHLASLFESGTVKTPQKAQLVAKKTFENAPKTTEKTIKASVQVPSNNATTKAENIAEKQGLVPQKKTPPPLPKEMPKPPVEPPLLRKSSDEAPPPPPPDDDDSNDVPPPPPPDDDDDLNDVPPPPPPDDDDDDLNDVPPPPPPDDDDDDLSEAPPPPPPDDDSRRSSEEAPPPPPNDPPPPLSDEIIIFPQKPRLESESQNSTPKLSLNQSQSPSPINTPSPATISAKGGPAVRTNINRPLQPFVPQLLKSDQLKKQPELMSQYKQVIQKFNEKFESMKMNDRQSVAEVCVLKEYLLLFESYVQKNDFNGAKKSFSTMYEDGSFKFDFKDPKVLMYVGFKSMNAQELVGLHQRLVDHNKLDLAYKKSEFESNNTYQIKSLPIDFQKSSLEIQEFLDKSFNKKTTFDAVNPKGVPESGLNALNYYLSVFKFNRDVLIKLNEGLNDPKIAESIKIFEKNIQKVKNYILKKEIEICEKFKMNSMLQVLKFSETPSKENLKLLTNENLRKLPNEGKALILKHMKSDLNALFPGKDERSTLCKAYIEDMIQVKQTHQKGKYSDLKTISITNLVKEAAWLLEKGMPPASWVAKYQAAQKKSL